tara:strand:- start:512 stop:844 length:333 start_codon:yes stop_codon:yes gene_type:complete
LNGSNRKRLSTEGQQASEDILEVYESGDEEEGDKVVDTTSAFRDIEELKFYWKDLPSEKEANKENRMKATQWTGQKVIKELHLLLIICLVMLLLNFFLSIRVKDFSFGDK